MKKTLIVTTLAIVMLLAFAIPAQAAIDIQAIYYNFDAAENEPALTIVRGYGKPIISRNAGEFQIFTQAPLKETSIADVEARLQADVDDFLVELIKLKDVDADDPVRQDPPVLVPGEKIVIINNQEYLSTQGMYFAIHIYSIDDLETPESELRFITRFQDRMAGEIPDNWW